MRPTTGRRRPQRRNIVTTMIDGDLVGIPVYPVIAQLSDDLVEAYITAYVGAYKDALALQGDDAFDAPQWTARYTRRATSLSAR